MSILSSGFGNSLVSLVFFLSMYFQIKGKSNKALLLAALLPLIRPDAILYSFTIFFVDFMNNRKIKLSYIAATIVLFLGYFGLFKLLYGHWIPIPIALKSVKPSMLAIIPWAQKLSELKWYITVHIIFSLSLLVSLSLRGFREVRNLHYYLFPLATIFLFYSFVSFYYHGDYRYCVGFELLATIFPLLLINLINKERVILKINSKCNNWKLDFSVLFQKWQFCIVLVVLFILPFYGKLRFPYSDGRLWQKEIVNAYGITGQVIDEIVPKEWTIATTELNSFGYMNDREIIDLIGYTNSEIAHSKILNSVKTRTNPDFFLSVLPDIYWYRTLPEDWFCDRPEALRNIASEIKYSTDSAGHSSVSVVETLFSNWEAVLTREMMSKDENKLGDMHKVVGHYDGVVFKIDEWVVMLLIKKELTGQLLQIFEQKNFVLTSSREIDLKKFKNLYDMQPLVQFKI